MAEVKENLLLASLPREERERLDPFLEWAEVEVEEVLIEPDAPFRQVFFPFDAVTSTLQELGDGSTIETGLIGVEGMIGIQLWLRMPSTPTRTIVQVAGRGHRMAATACRPRTSCARSGTDPRRSTTLSPATRTPSSS